MYKLCTSYGTHIGLGVCKNIAGPSTHPQCLAFHQYIYTPCQKSLIPIDNLLSYLFCYQCRWIPRYASGHFHGCPDMHKWHDIWTDFTSSFLFCISVIFITEKGIEPSTHSSSHSLKIHIAYLRSCGTSYTCTLHCISYFLGTCTRSGYSDIGNQRPPFLGRSQDTPQYPRILSIQGIKAFHTWDNPGMSRYPGYLVFRESR